MLGWLLPHVFGLNYTTFWGPVAQPRPPKPVLSDKKKQSRGQVFILLLTSSLSSLSIVARETPSIVIPVSCLLFFFDPLHVFLHTYITRHPPTQEPPVLSETRLVDAWKSQYTRSYLARSFSKVLHCRFFEAEVRECQVPKLGGGAFCSVVCERSQTLEQGGAGGEQNTLVHVLVKECRGRQVAPATCPQPVHERDQTRSVDCRRKKHVDGPYKRASNKRCLSNLLANTVRFRRKRVHEKNSGSERAKSA